MSIFDHPDLVPDAPSWRCPHCGTLQPETSRCWACTKSPVACGTCQFYRSSLVSEMSFCGLDQARAPIDAEEVRTCWKARTDPVDADAGLFSDAELRPTLPRGVVPAAPVVGQRTQPVSTPSTQPVQTSPLETDDPAFTRRNGGLVEAPHVAPGRRLISEAGRRARLGRRRRSVDLDLS
jgi:hypothetical protein